MFSIHAYIRNSKIDTVNAHYNDTVPQKFDIKLNFCCNEFKSKLNWYICTNTIDVVKNFAVIMSLLRVFTVINFLVFIVLHCFEYVNTEQEMSGDILVYLCEKL